MRRFLPFFFVLGMFLLAGCGEDQNKPRKIVKTPAASEPGVELSTVTMNDLLNKRIPAQKGKVVVMDIWASWCPPCRAEFHNLVRMHETYGDKGLVCMSLSMDEQDDKSKALTFLTKQNASFANYLLAEGFEAAGGKWSFNSIPTVVVYGRDGELAKVFTRSFSYGQVESFVKKLL